jgi:hypothetical protein
VVLDNVFFFFLLLLFIVVVVVHVFIYDAIVSFVAEVATSTSATTTASTAVAGWSSATSRSPKRTDLPKVIATPREWLAGRLAFS